MRLTVIFVFIILLGLPGCESTASKEKKEEASMEEQIEALREEVFSQENVKLDRRKALDLINLYVKFAETYPNDPQSPDFLFKAADISINLRRPAKTIQLFDQLMTSYPDYEKVPTALFLKGFVYEDQLQDYDQAKLAYELFLQKYPDSEYADDAEMSLKNLGKTPEQLIEEFERNGTR
jgi:outer membrane protein assembly factor BamD (BamD/ComL family)